MSKFRGRILGAALTMAFAGSMIASLAFAQTQADAHHTGIDAAIRPGDDFYHYANGPWLAATPLPEGVARLDTTSMLRAENARRVQSLIEEAAAAPTRPTAQLIGDYYASRLDTAAIEARGLAPLSADFAAIAAIADRRALAAYLGQTTRLDDGGNQQTESLWGVWIHQGFHDPEHYAAHIVQGGLGLADTADYLDAAIEHAAHRALYRAHIANILRTAGLDQPDLRAGRVLDLEIAIAATHASRADTDDVFKTDNTWTRADFAANAPGLDWDAYFTAAHLDHAPSFVVWQPRAVIGGAQLVANRSIDAWKDYLAFHLVEHYAAMLPSAIGAENAAFDARLAGAAAPSAPDPQREAIAATQAALGDAISQLYVARYFSPQARTAATAMVDNIRAAFRTRLNRWTWMSPQTRTQALEKLATLRVGLGYPETWIDYGDLAIVRGDAFGNQQRIEAFAYRREIAKLSRPVDPDEWAGQLHPHMVGAILNLSPNTMQFTAGLLQPPYFDPAGDAASNYGSAGAGIAHEISHSFDGVGNIYDAQGRLALWWTPEDLARYQAATAPLATQLDSCAHGAQILSESAADLAGLTIAHDAYILSLHGRRDAIINGLTGEQRFFIAFAQRWRRQQTDAALQQQIAGDSHAPPQCRSHLVRNTDGWVRAFGVRRGDPLYLAPEARIEIW
jgi:predicted metalloendopeptidase